MATESGQAGARQGTERSARGEQAGEARRALVLVIEDDSDIRDTLVESLEECGFSVAAADDGEEALHVLDGGLEPDVLVLDLMMPRMDGWALLKRLRADPRHARRPVLVISAAADTGSLGASACLAKPFHLDEFDRTVARLCRH